MTEKIIADCCNGLDVIFIKDKFIPLSNNLKRNKTVQNGIENGSSNQNGHILSVASLDLTSQSLEIFPENAFCHKHSLTCILLDYNDLSELPDSIKELRCLEVLSLNGNSISSLPNAIEFLENLHELHLNENDLAELPETFGNLWLLRKLYLTGNSIKTLPETFCKLASLEELVIEENGLLSLSENFGELYKLRSLQANDNRLSRLPTTFGKLRSLENLDLSSNKLVKFPDYFGDLKNVTYLDISKNCLEELPPYFQSCVKLKKLYLDYNSINTLPPWVSCMPEIIEFSIIDNKLVHKELTEEFALRSSKIKKLDLGGNFLTNLPESFGEMKCLEFVRIGSVLHYLERRNFQNGNWITSIPQSFGRLRLLKEVFLDENQIDELPAEFGGLVSLEMLDLGQNHLHELPESFGNLKSLRVCLLSKNKLQLLPSTIGQLSSLEDLRLDNNEIAELPESFKDLTQLKTLDLFNNQLRTVPDCLKQFTQLVRLDIDENNINEARSEIPSIIRNTRYAPRDPALKDNWRGKRREDLREIDQTEKNRYTVKLAVENNQSIWRKHGDEQTSRPKFERPSDRNGFRIPLFTSTSSLPSDSDEDIKGGSSSEMTPDEEYVKDVEQSSSKTRSAADNTAVSMAGSGQVTTEENWDDELDDGTGQFDLDDQREYYLPPEEYQYQIENRPFLCLPYTLHEPSVSRVLNHFHSVIGQFDDAD